MLSRHTQSGLSLIELMIGVTIVGILLGMGIPSFSLWIQNVQNRGGAESILNGLQLARTEALKRNAVVRFELKDENGLIAWNVGCVSVTTECPATIESRAANEGAQNARVGISTTAIPVPTPANQFSTAIAKGTGLPAGVSFNGIGRLANATGDIARIDITNEISAETRRYVVFLGPGGHTRMCDPALAFANNSQGCS